MSKYAPITYPAWARASGQIYEIQFDASYTYVNTDLPAPCTLTLTFTLTQPHLEGGVYWNLNNSVWNNTAWTPSPCYLYLDNTEIVEVSYNPNDYAYDSITAYSYYGAPVTVVDYITYNTNLFTFGINTISTGVHTLTYTCGGSTAALFGSSYPALGIGIANILQWGLPQTLTFSFNLPAGDIRGVIANIVGLYPGATSSFYMSFPSDPLPTATISPGYNAIIQLGSNNPHVIVISRNTSVNWGLGGMTALAGLEFLLNFTPVAQYKQTLTVQG